MKDESNPEGDIEIQITGLRPGEKLYEELLIGNDPQPTTLDRQRQSVIQIDTPGCRITVSPEKLHPIPPPRPREIRGRGRLDIAEWVSRTPDRIPVETPVVNRRGRTIKPRVIYDPEDEEQRNRELRERARQRVLDKVLIVNCY